MSAREQFTWMVKNHVWAAGRLMSEVRTLGLKAALQSYRGNLSCAEWERRDHQILDHLRAEGYEHFGVFPLRKFGSGMVFFATRDRAAFDHAAEQLYGKEVSR